MGATTAHKKPERVADETRIQVWAWMTNKCRGRKKEERRLQSLPPLKAFATKHKRTKEKKSQSSDQARGYTFTLLPDDSIIPPFYDHVRLLELSLKPSSWAHFLYQIYCIKPVGFGLICANSKEPPKRWTLQLAPSVRRLLVRWWVQWLVKARSNSLGEVMVASLLYHKRRTAKWFTAQWASGTMCVAFAPTRGQTSANLGGNPFGPRLRKAAAMRSTSRGLRGGTSSGR